MTFFLLANWVYQFSEKKTIDSTFYSPNGDELQTEMMTFSGTDLVQTKFNYTHSTDLNAQVCFLIGTLQRGIQGLDSYQDSDHCHFCFFNLISGSQEQNLKI